MSVVGVIIICIVILLLVVLGVVLTWVFGSERPTQLEALSGFESNQKAGYEMGTGFSSTRRRGPLTEEEEAPREEEKAVDEKSQDLVYFHAGFYSPEEIEQFHLKYRILMVILAPAFAAGAFYLFGNLLYAGAGFIGGILVGRIAPDRALGKRKKARQEEISFYLPLIIEQLGIGVSSGLDIGPCIAYIVDMAQERKANNAVTDLLGHVMRLTKAGMSLEEALLEIGTISGYASLRNTFIFLAQCSRHGGEISKQLLELSQAVSSERQSTIETMINGLSNKATMALGLVFGGFFIILLSGIGMRMMEAMK